MGKRSFGSEDAWQVERTLMESQICTLKYSPLALVSHDDCACLILE